MKNNIIWIIIICSFIYCTSYAQFDKGTRFTGASISLDGSSKQTKSEFNNQKYKTSDFQIAPQFQIGKFYKENHMMGLGLSLTASLSDGYEYKSRKFTPQLAPYLRQYNRLGEKWYIFLQESLPIQYRFGKDVSKNISRNYNTFMTGISVLPGIGVKVGNKLNLESDINLLGLDLFYLNGKNSNVVVFNSLINTGINSQFTLRAAWYIH